jgi:RNA methyltransferase, TrmH family
LITSVSNDKIKFARSLARAKERETAQQFLIEGTRLIQEAKRAGMNPALAFYERSALQHDGRVRQLVVGLQAQMREVFEVSATVMRALSDTESPQGIAAVFHLPRVTPPSKLRLVLILDGMRDPGNLGTMLRTAWAANVDAVYLAPETVDAFNPKVVRAAMGAHFHVPLLSASWDEIRDRLESIPRIYLSDAQGEIPYTRADWSPPCALIVGGEARGAGEQARQIATATISIPMPGKAESLNAAVAAGVLLFEALKST